jgi:hypothetical protein
MVGHTPEHHEKSKRYTKRAKKLTSRSLRGLRKTTIAVIFILTKTQSVACKHVRLSLESTTDYHNKLALNRGSLQGIELATLTLGDTWEEPKCPEDVITPSSCH